jgi:superfamily II DNA helicase RecQ
MEGDVKRTKLETDLFYYGNYLELISNFGLSKQLTLNDLGNSSGDKAVIQKCYRDIKKEKFPGTVIDYLCLVSYRNVRQLFDKEISVAVNKDPDQDRLYNIAKQHVANCRIDLKKIKYPDYKQLREGEEFVVNIMVTFLLVSHQNEIHSTNMIRLFNRNPWLIIEEEDNWIINVPTLGFIMQSLNFFTLMMCLNCYEMLKEKLVDKSQEMNLWEYMLPRFIEMIVSKRYISDFDKKTFELINGLEFNMLNGSSMTVFPALIPRN